MTDYTVYNTTTGVITSTGTCPDDMLSVQAESGEAVLPVPSNPPYDRVKLTGAGAPYVYLYMSPGSSPDPAPPPIIKDLVDALADLSIGITMTAVNAKRDARLGL